MSDIKKDEKKILFQTSFAAATHASLKKCPRTQKCSTATIQPNFTKTANDHPSKRAVTAHPLKRVLSFRHRREHKITKQNRTRAPLPTASSAPTSAGASTADFFPWFAVLLAPFASRLTRAANCKASVILQTHFRRRGSAIGEEAPSHNGRTRDSSYK